MQMTKYVFALVAALFVSLPAAQADFLLEPYVGYHTGDIESDGDKDDISGLAYGARAGWQGMGGFMAGVDFMKGALEDDEAIKTEYDITDIGAFVGYNFPFLLRVYGVYGISSKATSKNSLGESDVDGTSIKLGVGFTFLPMVSVNVEYYMSTWETDTAPTQESEAKTLGVSVSLPLNL